MEQADDLAGLTTEASNPASSAIDTLSSLEIVRLINAEDAGVADAVGKVADAIAMAIDAITDRLRNGGRLIYMGAGTSGRLGVLDASECPPTFSTPPELVVGLIAGGKEALTRAIEGAEDHPEYGERDLRAIDLSAQDAVVGIATSGRTPYVIGGLKFARSIGACAIGLSCNADSALTETTDLMITPIVGPEVISGSTRMKAGTATKMVLNMLTTGAMVRLGKTFGNIMVDLRATNSKLKARARRIVCRLADVDAETADALLAECDGEVKTAIVAHLCELSASNARQRLREVVGHLRAAIDNTESS